MAPTTTTCADCTSDDLDVVFGHTCPNDPRSGGPRPVQLPAKPNARRATDTSGRGHGGNGPAATDAQVRYLVRLGMAEVDAKRLGKTAASDEIAKRLEASPKLPQPAPTENQLRFLRTLAADRDSGITDVDAYLATAATMTRQQASKAIDFLKGLPARQSPTPAPTTDPRPAADSLPGPDAVPAGSYALDGTDGAKNEVVFYEVDRPSKGRWAGHVFVSLVIGGRSNQNVPRSHVAGILTRIVAAGPQQAMARFGHELGQCGVCHRHLTDDESRARGIGPVCAAGLGW